MNRKLLLALLAVISSVSYMVSVFAEDYTYNMTKQEKDEFIAAEICMNTDIVMPLCDTLVGRIDKDYGDAMK